MVKFNYELAFLIEEELKSKRQGRYIPNYKPEFCEFSNQELQEITSLKLINFSSINDIEKLPNLRKLSINSVNYANIINNDPLASNPYINHITDFTPLGNLVGLESLKINNDINIEELDLTSLKRLHELILTNNPNLRKVYGLDSLTGLEKVIIYGSDLDINLNVDSYIKNTLQAETNVLDISLYPKIVGTNSNISKFITDSSVLGYTHLKFAEQVAFVDCAILDVNSMKTLYENCLQLLKRNRVKEMSEIEQIAFVYKYVVRNVKFDDEGLYQRMIEFYKMKEQYNDIPPFIKKKFAMLHSSFMAMMYHKSNCEGYVNLMKFMLSILGIKSYDVHCVDPSNGEIDRCNHAVMRVPYNGMWYYCDPTMENITGNNYFMMTKDQISKTLILNTYERELSEEYRNAQYNGANIKRRK